MAKYKKASDGSSYVSGPKHKLRTGELTEEVSKLLNFLEIPHKQKQHSIILKNITEEQLESLRMVSSLHSAELKDILSIEKLEQWKMDDSSFLQQERNEIRALEKEVRELMHSVPVYHVESIRGLDRNEWDARAITQDDLDLVAPNGIHCADDIRESGWLFDSPRNGYLGTRLSEELVDRDDEYEY